MNIGDFRQVVFSLPSDRGHLVTVANVIEAAECLTFDWPVTGGKAIWRGPDHVYGRLCEDDARRAFLLAAQEAGVPVVLQWSLQGV